jgi:hypothetical protein
MKSLVNRLSFLRTIIKGHRFKFYHIYLIYKVSLELSPLLQQMGRDNEESSLENLLTGSGSEYGITAHNTMAIPQYHGLTKCRGFSSLLAAIYI